jgi:chorismate synthase
VNHPAHISKFPTEGLEAIAHFSVKQTAQTIRMTAKEMEVAKLIGNIGKTAKFASIGGEVVVVAANIYNIATNPTAENYARAGISGLAIGVNALNLVVAGLGLGLSLGITAIDAAGGFEWFYDEFK